MNNRRLIAVAPNGARRTKTDHEALPTRPEEIAHVAREALQAGAGLIHLHVRDDANQHSLDPARYRDALSAIKDTIGDALITQVTTEACGIYSRDEQMCVVQTLRPEACSIALRELCPTDQPEDTATFRYFLEDCYNEGILLQYILYDNVDLARFRRLQSEGIIPDGRPFVLLVIGRYTSNPDHWQPEFLTLMNALHAAPDMMPDWAVCGFGVAQLSIITAAASLGGHVRIGFENGLHFPDGTLARTNGELVGACTTAFKGLGLSPMTAAEARDMGGAHLTL